MMVANRAPSVLIVEDERIVAMDIQQALKEIGYDAFAIASSSEEAIARVSEKCPDLVLMDIRIKGHRDGIETADILKTKCAVPIVYLTAHSDDGTITRAKKTEPYGYLVKPVRSAELRSVIEVALYKHEMEKRLRERERWFSTTIRSIADAVIAVDLSGNVMLMNAAAEELTGAKLTAATGKPIREVFQLVDQPAGDESPLLRVLREGRTVELREGNLLNVSSGAVRLVDDSAAPVVDDEQMLGAVMVFRDVTDQKRIQKQLELSDRLVSLGTMAAGVAHEINNPLAGVAGNAELLDYELRALRATSLSPENARRLDEMSECLQDVRSSAERIRRIVSDLRYFSQRADPVAGAIDVNQCVQWAIRTTAHEFRLRANLVANLGDIPPVKADETRLGQVLFNLLVNAAHAIPPGAVHRNTVSVATRTAADGRVLIEVRDTGEGIPKDLQKRIFDPFFTTKAVGVGTGLGLSICHGIVSSMGGEILVDSESGKGTVFQVLLPGAVQEQVTPLTSPAKLEEVRRGRILVVDDEIMVLGVIERILRGHDVTCVRSAREAVALIEQGQWFDVILSDIVMPEMTGIEFYETLIGRYPERAQSVIFMSGGAMTSQVEDFLQSIRNLHIEKPFSVESLREAVQRLLEERVSRTGGMRLPPSLQ